MAHSRRRSALYSYDVSHSSLPIRSSRRFWRLRAMNSCNALVITAFLLRSPLSLRANPISSGSIDRFVGMCNTPRKPRGKSQHAARIVQVEVKRGTLEERDDTKHSWLRTVIALDDEK